MLTIGFARRATAYKRAPLIFLDLDRLREINRRGRLQLVFAGKAHPRDEGGKEIIREIYHYMAQLKGEIKVVYLENYDMDMAAKLTSGVDVWLNTPLPPLEASGTSGMKAAHNGVPSFSVLDGWWVEGCIEGVTGWAIGPQPDEPVTETERRRREVDDIYNKLEYLISPNILLEERRLDNNHEELDWKSCILFSSSMDDAEIHHRGLLIVEILTALKATRDIRSCALSLDRSISLQILGPEVSG